MCGAEYSGSWMEHLKKYIRCGSPSGIAKDSSLLGCDPVLGECFLFFQRRVVPLNVRNHSPSSTVKHPRGPESSL